MKKYQILFSIFLLLGAILSCEKTETQQKRTNVNFSLKVENIVLSEGVMTITNQTTKVEQEHKVTISNNNFSLSLAEGLYNMAFVAKQGDYEHKAYLESVQVVGDEVSFSLSPFIVDTKADFVIEEIFYTGTVYPDTKKGYIGDQFIKITNNSDKVLYADGLTIAESAFTTSMKFEYTPNIMSNAVTVQALYSVPGNGTEHPVQPGESIIISDRAINHKEGQPASFDLSKSSFEWYDDSSMDTDNPAVPNLEKIYCYTKTIWILSKQGNRSYMLIRMGVDKKEYLEKYKYDYTYISADREIKSSDYKIPNEWILDAVTFASTDGWKWNCIDVTLDAGYTYCGENSKDVNRFGKMVRRKKLSVTDSGRIILKDTNNSSVDFDRDVIPFQ